MGYVNLRPRFCLHIPPTSQSRRAGSAQSYDETAHARRPSTKYGLKSRARDPLFPNDVRAGPPRIAGRCNTVG